ncbi:unnamed protein product [Oncorhynchus mykiss]|uniref:G-protein coupled receptors family 1 profile domain-containing protein n=1 Tax=Oncorhynchus mykiss TaxID=8022 RepID=A0A060X864_ONCMY|nr:unnamed protein product [Oncorhynchus mykiss]
MQCLRPLRHSGFTLFSFFIQAFRREMSVTNCINKWVLGHCIAAGSTPTLQGGSFNPDFRPPETLFKVIFWLGYFNSCLNPIIYPCYSREFKLAFIRILRCQCHHRRRPGWHGYNYRTSHFNSASHSRKNSAESGHSQKNPACLNGSQRTLSSSASPSPSYMLACPEGEALYTCWASAASRSPSLLPGTANWEH